ncbi:MAG: hypothetical protein Q4D24_07305 [Erysipelotrichaceae bacterium]|nr:hypothetical protein [Erysipelotrichaceae bacterium]
MEYTNEQIRAAYALNLCTVSVSQIIDYADVNIMEQEYEAILNNLNLEQFPKDEALLNILKQILDTITTFRINEEDKSLVEKEYQQKVKNGIWEAVPSIGMIIGGVTPLTMSLSLVTQIGISYMNYRRSKAEREIEVDKARLKLDNAALEQFNALRRNLFDTAWRLSDRYGFSDELRLSEKQIHQFNMILMDSDPVRKFERLDMIKDDFMAYPPFWYYYGNTADTIADSPVMINLGTRDKYRNTAMEAFRQFREVNKYSLLRQDCIASANALELADLLDQKNDVPEISDLVGEAVRYSGKENDILQLAAMEYLNIGMHEEAEKILRQLVNEQYNTIMNAQLLSGVYINAVRKTGSVEAKQNYRILASRVGLNKLFPMPQNNDAEQEMLEEKFTNEQKKLLTMKYRIVFDELADRYAEKFKNIIPAPSTKNPDLQKREQIFRVFSDPGKAEQYIAVLRDAGIPFRIIDLLNDIFEDCGTISFIGDAVMDRLYKDIEKAVFAHQEYFAQMQKKLNDGSFEKTDMEQLLDLDLMAFTSELYKDLGQETIKYVETREELLDFSIADINLMEFCRQHYLSDPTLRIGKDGNELRVPSVPKKRRLEYALLGSEAIDASNQNANSTEMLMIIKEQIPKILKPDSGSKFFMRDDSKLDRYFNKVYLLKKDPALRTHTLAILDGTGATISDLIFTTHGIVTVRGQIVRKMIPYHDIEWSEGINKELVIDGWYINDDVNMDALYELIKRLSERAERLPEFSETRFGIPQ